MHLEQYYTSFEECLELKGWNERKYQWFLMICKSLLSNSKSFLETDIDTQKDRHILRYQKSWNNWRMIRGLRDLGSLISVPKLNREIAISPPLRNYSLLIPL